MPGFILGEFDPEKWGDAAMIEEIEEELRNKKLKKTSSKKVEAAIITKKIDAADWVVETGKKKTKKTTEQKKNKKVGKVNFWKDTYGFVIIDGKSLFCHQNDLVGIQPSEFVKGANITCDLIYDEKRKQTRAINVGKA